MTVQKGSDGSSLARIDLQIRGGPCVVEGSISATKESRLTVTIQATGYARTICRASAERPLGCNEMRSLKSMSKCTPGGSVSTEAVKRVTPEKDGGVYSLMLDATLLRQSQQTAN